MLMSTPVNGPLGRMDSLLEAWSSGDTKALDRLMPMVTAELRRIAGHLFRDEPSSHTLQPTAVVNEAYLRLRRRKAVRMVRMADFYGAAAQVMRHILVDHARRRRAAKRGASVPKEPLRESLAYAIEPDLELLALDEALEKLARLDPRQSRIVERRIFAGLDFQDIARSEGIGRTTVWKEWSTALLWLRRELGGPGAGDHRLR